MTAALVPAEALLETVIASALAGIGVSFAFALAIWGVARLAEHSREERPLAAAVSAVLAAAGLTSAGAAVIVGLVLVSGS